MMFSSTKLKAHWWAYSIGRPLLSSTLIKHLWISWANQNKISYGASMGMGNESLFKWSWSHDQDGCHVLIWQKPLKICLFRTELLMSLKIGIQHRALFCSNDDLWSSYTKVKFGSICFYMGKFLNSGLLRNHWSPWFKVCMYMYRKLNEYTKMYKFLRSRSFFDLCPRSLIFHLFQTGSAPKPLGQLKLNCIWNLHESRGPKIYWNSGDHMTTMATMPIYGKNF